VSLIRSHRFALAVVLLVAQTAGLGHLLLAEHSVCADSGHLVEGAAPVPVPETTTEAWASSSRSSDEHCLVIDAAQAPAVLAQSLVFVVVEQDEAVLLGAVRAGWSRCALIDAPKASPPARV
jgi:hypothetical protein